MAQPRLCPDCSAALAAGDTVILTRGRVTHFDCKRPHTLNPEERLLLFRYCWDHAVCECRPCTDTYRLSALSMDLVRRREHLCPRCRADLTESIRTHLYACTMLPANVRRRAKEAREGRDV
jgi:hypothetical protein